MTSFSRRLLRHGSLPAPVARLVLAAFTVLCLVLVTAVGVNLGAGPAAALADAGVQGPSVVVAQPGRDYISSTSTDRPVLHLSGWTDASGAPLNAPDNATTNSVAVQVRLVDDEGWFQAGVIYPEFAAGSAHYALPLWPFTNDMDPHEGTYRIEWRASSESSWVLVDTIGLDVRLPQPAEGAVLERAGALLVGTGWTFDRTTSIGGIFKVALALTLPDGTVRQVTVRAYFAGTSFVLDIADLVAAGAPADGGYTVTAVSDGALTATRVDIPSAPVEPPSPSPEPTPEPPAKPTQVPTAEPTSVPTAEPTSVPTAEPTSVPTAEPTSVPTPEPTPVPTPEPTPVPTAEPTPVPTPVPTPEPTPVPTAEPTPVPTPEPTPEPTPVPTAEPTPVPSAEPTPEPSVEPTAEPQSEPATEPAAEPTTEPVVPVVPVEPAEPVEPVEPEPVPEDPAQAPEPTAEPVTAVEPEERSTPEAAVAEAPAEEPGPGQAEAATDPNAKPETEPSSPVSGPGDLDASNAGSLSGTRNGDKVTLILPSSKAKEGDWVAVFVYPGATTAGWVQVDGAQSVSIDVSGFGAGTYQVAIADRDSELLGWAQLEIAAVSAPASEGTAVLTIGAEQPGHGLLGPGDWMLVTAGGLLALAAGAVILLVRPATVVPRRRGHAQV